MLDSSGSMRDKMGKGVVKWDAATKALGALLKAPSFAGIGVGLPFFFTLPKGRTGKLHQQCSLWIGRTLFAEVVQQLASGFFVQRRSWSRIGAVHPWKRVLESAWKFLLTRCCQLRRQPGPSSDVAQ